MSGIPTYNMNPKSRETLYNGQKNVTAAGVAEALAAASTPCFRVLIQAKPTNTAFVFVGGAGVPNDNTGGVSVAAGNAVQLDCMNLADLFVNAAVTGEGVTFIYWKA